MSSSFNCDSQPVMIALCCRLARASACVLWACLVLCGNCALLFAASIEGRVVALSDGDTISVLDRGNVQHKIRLTGIDAPEKKQAFGRRSRENLSNLILGKTVVVEWAKFDRYHRILGKVLVNGIDANLEQLRAGFAWHYKQYEKEQSVRDRVAYAEAEHTARTEGRGLWQDPNPISPWEFRQMARRR